MIFVIGGAYQGKTEYVKENFGEAYNVIDDYNLVVKEQLIAGENPISKAKETLSCLPENTIIISCELGSGLVPVEAFEREYRETNGRVNCLLAKEAQEVIRVMCGIGSRIK